MQAYVLGYHLKQAVQFEHIGKNRLLRIPELDSGSSGLKVSVFQEIGVPVGNIRKFIAIGLNYTDRAAEGGVLLPEEPIVFSKAISCLAGPDDDVPLPRGSAIERLGD